MSTEETTLPRSNRAISKDYLLKIRQLETTHKQLCKKCTSKLERNQLIEKHKKDLQLLKDAMDSELQRKCCDVPSNLSSVKESNIKQPEIFQKRTDAFQVLQPEMNTAFSYKTENILSKKKKKKITKRLAKSSSLIVSEKSTSDEISLRQAEAAKLNEIIRQDGLRIYAIAADGHCMFRAVEHQLTYNFPEKYWDYKTLRTKVTEYLRDNKSALMPFYFDSSDNTSNDSSIDDYDIHCNGISKDTWGGELELRALVNILKHNIHIYSATPPYKLVYTPDIDSDSPKSEIILRLSFHKHEYNSGPHYHSLVPIKREDY